jgi:hypothetical protein
LLWLFFQKTGSEVLLHQPAHVRGQAAVLRLGTLFDFLHEAGVRPEADEFFFCAHIVKKDLTGALAAQLLFNTPPRREKINSPANPVPMRVSIEIFAKMGCSPTLKKISDCKVSTL